MKGDWGNLSDEALGQRLARELPRYPAPAHLRRAIVRAATPPRPRFVWFAPALSALATVALVVLFVMPTLPSRTPTDVVQRLVNAVVAEHSRALLWGARTAEIMPAALPRLEQEAGIGLSRAFLGDEQLVFLGAEPVYLDWRRGVALHYRDPDGHRVTYVVLHAANLPVPERMRIEIQGFRPALVKVNGFATWVWKQGDLACFLVSDRVSDGELPGFKDYFLRVRKATEPYTRY
jgi:hypothetical protein